MVLADSAVDDVVAGLAEEIIGSSAAEQGILVIAAHGVVYAEERVAVGVAEEALAALEIHPYRAGRGCIADGVFETGAAVEEIRPGAADQQVVAVAAPERVAAAAAEHRVFAAAAAQDVGEAVALELVGERRAGEVLDAREAVPHRVAAAESDAGQQRGLHPLLRRAVVDGVGAAAAAQGVGAAAPGQHVVPAVAVDHVVELEADDILDVEQPVAERIAERAPEVQEVDGHRRDREVVTRGVGAVAAVDVVGALAAGELVVATQAAQVVCSSSTASIRGPASRSPTSDADAAFGAADHPGAENPRRPLETPYPEDRSLTAIWPPGRTSSLIATRNAKFR